MNLNLKTLTMAFVTSLLIVSCKCDRGNVNSSPVVVENPDEEVTNSKIDSEGNYIYEIGNLFDLTLPNGMKLNVGENSTENKIFKFLNDANSTVSEDKTVGWVTLDRVYFSTGKADLTDVSETQIKNIVTILEAFPSATVKIGGYTDNTGDAEINQKVSTDRAKTVTDRIITNGIDQSRIESEGYGANHFVCAANDTDECRAQNRRVDIRVTKK